MSAEQVKGLVHTIVTETVQLLIITLWAKQMDTFYTLTLDVRR